MNSYFYDICIFLILCFECLRYNVTTLTIVSLRIWILVFCSILCEKHLELVHQRETSKMDRILYKGLGRRWFKEYPIGDNLNKYSYYVSVVS